MVIRHSFLARFFFKRNAPYFMCFGIAFSRERYPEHWHETQMKIRSMQYVECVVLGLLLAALPAFFWSLWILLGALVFYHLLYVVEWLLYRCFCSRRSYYGKRKFCSAFVMEAKKECFDPFYLRRRHCLAWMKFFGRCTK